MRRTPLRRRTRLRRQSSKAPLVKKLDTPRRHKFGIAPPNERTRLGIIYDSKMEMRYADKLELLRHAVRMDQRVADIKRQVAIPLEVNDCLICYYRADFEVTFADGRVELHEVKGLDTREWRIKEKLLRALFPNHTLKIIRRV